VRQVAAQRLAAFVQVLHLRRVVGRFVERNVGELAVGNRDVEAIAEGLDVLVAQLLGLVDVVLALADLAHAETLDGFHEQHGRLAFVLLRGVEGGVHLLRIMAAARAGSRSRRRSGRSTSALSRARIVLAEEVLAHVGAARLLLKSW
jgi:hypothetical protein